LTDTYHLQKSYRNTAIGCLLFFLAMMVLGVCLAASEANILAAVMFGGFWGFWVGLSVRMLLAYYRESLGIRDGTVIHQGILRTKSLTLEEILDVRWKRRGVVVLRSKPATISIYLNNFTREQQKQLIRWLRFSIPCSVQQGWDRFFCQFAMRLWFVERPLREDQLVRTRRRCNRFFISFILVVAVIGVGFAWYIQEGRWLLIPAPFVVFWLFVRAMLPKTEYVSQWKSSQGTSNRQRLGFAFARRLGIWFVVTAVAVWLIDVFKGHIPRSDLWQWLVASLYFGVLVVEACRLEQRQWHVERESAALAAQEWEQTEKGRIASQIARPHDDAPRHS
jgi:hypothetical protein